MVARNTLSPPVNLDVTLLTYISKANEILSSSFKQKPVSGNLHRDSHGDKATITSKNIANFSSILMGFTSKKAMGSAVRLSELRLTLFIWCVTVYFTYLFARFLGDYVVYVIIL